VTPPTASSARPATSAPASRKAEWAPAPRDLRSQELAVFERLIDIGKLLERRANENLRAHAKVKFIGYEVLVRLRNAGGKLRMQDLADQLVSTPSGLTYQMALLEKRGLAIRTDAPDDDRGVVARITLAGRALLRKMYSAQSNMIFGAVVAPLSEEQIDQLHEALGILQASLRGVAMGGILPSDLPDNP
jgi:DNA-binding MarR family transcriptional regulator